MNDTYFFSDFAYQVASWIESSGRDQSIWELDIEEPEIQYTLYKFSKHTILHYCIFTYIHVFLSKDFRKNPEKYFYWGEDVPNPLEELFDNYHVDRIKFSDFTALRDSTDEDENVYDLLYEWFADQDEAFFTLWGKVAEEVFFILFSNRRFLKEFHMALSEYIASSFISLNPEYLTTKGTIRRAYIPKWVKKAVYCRDHGRCVLCNKDLSGILSTDRQQHYDHIVPLDLMGVNDPTNIQLLCEQCNLKKSSKTIVTETRYPRWW